MIDHDRHIPFWRAVGKAVHEYDCRFILQLSHGGRQRDIQGIEYRDRSELDSKPDPGHGFKCEAMTVAEIRATVDAFAEGARRAREAGLDGVELHGANGYLITQFLSSAINDRKDDYGGPLENRARFVLEVVRAIRKKVGNDFHLQMKISVQETLRRRRPSSTSAHRAIPPTSRCRCANGSSKPASMRFMPRPAGSSLTRRIPPAAICRSSISSRRTTR